MVFNLYIMNQDTILRIYTRLTALKNNLPSTHDVNEKYVKDYHELLDLLQNQAGTSLNEFKVPENEIEYSITSVWPAIPSLGQEAGQTYSDDKYCERTLFLNKIDALLTYFQIKYLSNEKLQMGFRLPEQ